MGVIQIIRIKSDVRAGLVVADVAVLCVERKSVISSNGPNKILQRVVNSLIVSTISSKLFWCRVPSTSGDCFLFRCFSPVTPVDDSGEYRLEYMPKINAVTTMMGPAYVIMSSK